MARRSARPFKLNLSSPPDERISHTDYAFNTLRELILAHDLPAGTPLIESQLVREMSISKTPIREALWRLVNAGLVEYMLGRGMTVRTITMKDVQPQYDLRLMLEPFAMMQSVPRMTSLEFAALERSLEKAQDALKTGDVLALRQHDSDFHRMLYHHATNTELVLMLDRLTDQRQMVVIDPVADKEPSDLAVEDHRAIFNAIQRRDLPIAVRRLKFHIVRMGELTVQRADQIARRGNVRPR